MIELLVTVAVVAILATLAAPSFRETLQRNRIAGQVNSFVADLQFARSEAMKRGQNVTVCPSSDGQNCSGGNTWQGGWVVFNDANASGGVDSGEMLRQQPGLSNGDTFAVNPDDNVVITYNREGFAAFAGSTLVMSTSPVNNGATRCITVNRVGRHKVSPASSTGSCA